MKRLANSTLVSGLIMFGLAGAPAQAHDGSGHAVHGSHPGLQPYLCDVLETGDFTSQFARDGFRLPVVVNVTQAQNDFYCANAGCFVTPTHSIRFNNISIDVKLTGNTRPNEIYVQVFIDGDGTPWAFGLKDAIKGATSADGYTTYVWTAQSVAGTNNFDGHDHGFPSTPTFINEYGIESDVEEVGTSYFDRVRINGLQAPKNLETLVECVFSDPIDCETPK